MENSSIVVLPSDYLLLPNPQTPSSVPLHWNLPQLPNLTHRPPSPDSSLPQLPAPIYRLLQLSSMPSRWLLSSPTGNHRSTAPTRHHPQQATHRLLRGFTPLTVDSPLFPNQQPSPLPSYPLLAHSPSKTPTHGPMLKLHAFTRFIYIWFGRYCGMFPNFLILII